MELEVLASAKEIITGYWPHVSAAAISSVAVLGTALFTYFRRPKSSVASIDPYFTEAALLSPPLARPAYSDRMAYVLAEMSDLAYYQFEGQQGCVDDAVENFMSLDVSKDTDVRAFLEQFSTDMMSGRRLQLESMKKILSNSGFSLLDVIDINETQGFACKRDVENEPSYVVLAFRGTEKKISDWLTDARCVPAVKGKCKVHTGFHEAFTKKRDADGKTVKMAVEDILSLPEAKDDSGAPLPLFVTGHSLGGALALLATKLVVPNVNGACYTFGAPRIGNYEYFRQLKTPVYRVVNSSDIVPRVPPGAIMMGFVLAVQGMSWLTSFAPPVSAIFDRLGEFLDKLNGYRHFGDLRYLTDVAAGRFDTVRLLPNPPALERIMWLWTRIAKSLFVPVKSHSMRIYRKKLQKIAYDRNSA
ncbi:MAG: lipase family protein [Rhodobacteraceae bacterium]|nr:lipase family protein [Paracoccaceae bacterium]